MTVYVSSIDDERRELLRWTASLGAITADALALRRGISQASARGRLAAACRRGQLTRSQPLNGRPALFTLTVKGAHSIGLIGLRRCQVADATAGHSIECAWVAAALERCYPDRRVLGERELRLIERDRGRALASARLFGACAESDRVHRPDLVLVSADRTMRPVAVEVELSVKAPRRLREICRAWRRCREVAGVIYLVNSLTRAPVSRAVRDAGAQERIAVLTLDLLRGGVPSDVPA
ncbi:MAG TPA: hypothetical protein VFW38_05990 [Solirubrobacteraceae bacterium]|nr:hypothetical protein [Solirubrobacteraceae bacterium]